MPKRQRVWKANSFHDLLAARRFDAHVKTMRSWWNRFGPPPRGREPAIPRSASPNPFPSTADKLKLNRTDAALAGYRIRIAVSGTACDHAVSVVREGRLRSCAKATQARSPSDRSADRVAGLRAPQATACSVRKGATCTIGSIAASASSAGIPRSVSWVITSAKFAALRRTSGIWERTTPAHGSLNSKASTAELSAIALIILGRCVAFGDQFSDERRA